MPTVKPFAAVRPRPELAGRICELPYDVVSTEEARAVLAANPLSFFQASKPEVHLPSGQDPYAREAYACAAAKWRQMLERGQLCRDPAPSYYLYRQETAPHSQTGIVALAGCADYRQGAVRRHELTRPDKEDDRVRHIEALGAQTGPAFLFYRSQGELESFIQRRTALTPGVDFLAEDGVRHSGWVVQDAAGLRILESVFRRLPRLYIADGHHRTAAAARVAEQRQSAGGSGGFLAVIFPHTQTQILPYHRVLRDLNGLTPARLLERLAEVFEVRPGKTAAPSGKHELGVYLGSSWQALRFRPALVAAVSPLEGLDVSLLQQHVLGPVFGIEDPRRSERLDFVGGLDGVQRLEAAVNSGRFACAFRLFPTSIEDLMSIADAGQVLPPKSTWFEPKLRDGLFSHLI